MKLSSLQLSNFRQFRGTSPEIVFASPGDRPITVFFGTNGAGKTALLNAFTWTLYGTTSRGFLQSDQVVNKTALREAAPETTVSAWIELKFEHLGNRYSLKKTQTVRRGATEAEITMLGDPVSELQWAGPDGRWNREGSVLDAIGRILPVDLHTYFFFDGERIERLVQPQDDERADIASATKRLFSLEIFERAIRHVKSAKKSLESEYHRVGDAKVHELLDRKRVLEAESSTARDRASELARNLDGHRRASTEIELRLRELLGARELQARRDGLREDRKARAESLRMATSEISSLVSSSAYSVFLTDACATYKALVASMESRGELPSGIKRQFVEEILKRNICICGAPLDHEVAPQARATVEEWKLRAGLVDVEEKVYRMHGEIRQLETQTGSFWRQLDHFQERRESDKKELSRIENELERVSEQLKDTGDQEIGKLEEKLRGSGRAAEDDLREQGSCYEKIKSNDQQLTKLDVELSKHHAAEAKQIVAQRRVNVATEIIDRISRSKAAFEKQFRIDLTKKTRALFEVISYKPYVVHIGEDFSLQLKESAGGMALPVAAGQGENQVLSLCFIGAVIELAREYQVKKEGLPGPDSSQYPVVMDSPFGSLGPTLRRQVADHITRLADQVVIMVTNTQWRGEVEQSLRGRIGRTYVMQYWTPKSEFSQEQIEVAGSSFELIKASPSEYEYTTLLEVASA